MARERGPYSVAFPVNFTSQGDTTRDAFRKHMDEITRIYGILTGLDADTLDADDVNAILKAHIDSANPHPNYKPKIGWNDLTSKPSLGDLSGNFDASRVYGELRNATISRDKVNGLSDYIDGKIPSSKGDGITQSSLNESGYAKFNNGLLIQWGKMPLNTGHQITGGFDGDSRAAFPTQFPSKCFGVVANLGGLLSSDSNQFVYNLDIRVLVTYVTNQYFWYYTSYNNNNQYFSSIPDYIHGNYIAIGV